jgi:hydroxymethylpyrimidine/phosphomethylpyrimidine kinase
VRPPVVLAIGGIDTGNGAGVESDVRAMASLGVHAVLAPTALTIQTTSGIRKVVPVEPSILGETIAELYEDFRFNLIKSGMIWEGQAEIVAEFVRSHDVRLIVDPVMKAKDGTVLIPDLEGLKSLVGLSYAVTPNVPEAEVLIGRRIESLKDQVDACKELSSKYEVENVIVKGGHLGGYDVGCFSGEVVIVKGEKIERRSTHGTGSAFASYFTALIALGIDPIRAFETAVKLVKDSIRWSLEVGKGIGPVNVLAKLHVDAEKYRVVQEMTRVGDFISKADGFHHLIPEVQMNVAHSLNPEMVDGLGEIATFRDRITKTWNNEVRVGYPIVFGKPTHTARLLLAAIKEGSDYTFVVNIRYSDAVVRALRAYYNDVVEINRLEEPKEISETEGRSMEWVIRKAKSEFSRVPHVIYDKGAVGKEPMVRLLTENVDELLSVFEHLLGRVKGKGWA